MCVCFVGTSHYSLCCIEQIRKETLAFLHSVPRTKKTPDTWQAEAVVSGASLTLREGCAIKPLLNKGTRRPVAPFLSVPSLVYTLKVLCFLCGSLILVSYL